MTKSNAYEVKVVAVSHAVYKYDIAQGLNLDDEVKKQLVNCYLLAVQCVWLRIETEQKVDDMLVKYEDTIEDSFALLSTHNFDDLVYTYRSLFTNLYSFKSGEKRWYKLSKETFVSFQKDVLDGKIVVQKPQVNKRVVKPTTKVVVPPTNSLLTKFAMSIQPTTKVVVPPTKTKVVAKATKTKAKQQVKATTKVVAEKVVPHFEKVSLKDINDKNFYQFVLKSGAVMFGTIKISKRIDEVIVVLKNKKEITVKFKEVLFTFVWVR
jgi:hypothetical protein